MTDIHALIGELDTAAQEYAWERELGPAAVEKKRLDNAKAALALEFSDGRPKDIAEILAQPKVIACIRYLVRRALLSGGVADPHATRLALSFAEKLEQGAPEVTAINLVEAVLEGAQFRTQSPPETTTAPESAAEVTSR